MNWLRALLRLLRIGRTRGVAVPSSPAEPTAAETTVPTPLVVIGVDFGTSGTKVVVRSLDKGRPASAVDFGTDHLGFSRFSLPSTIALDNSRFQFGVKAEHCQTGTVFRSLKRTLITTDRDVRQLADSEVPPRPQNLGGHPHFLVAVYLSAVLRQVRELAAQEYGADSEYLYNLDIPVSRLDGGPMQRGYQTALDAAVDFAETDGLQLDDYGALWECWIEVLNREGTGSTDQELKRWELIPESSAIVKGAEAALASIVPNSRRYTAIADIGAGTIDLGWFKWITSEDEDNVFFFSARTSLVGCDDIDDKLLDIIGVSDADRPLLFPVVREAKPELSLGHHITMADGYGSLSPDDLEQATAEVAVRCFDEYGVSFGKAYEKEKNTDRWKDIRVILVGGGSQLEGFRSQFSRHPRWQFGRHVDFLLPGSSDSVGFPKKTVGAIGVSSEPPIEADVVFLLPALGLSYPAVEIPDPTLPHDIAPLPPAPQGPTGLYVYEAPDDD